MGRRPDRKRFGLAAPIYGGEYTAGTGWILTARRRSQRRAGSAWAARPVMDGAAAR
jgi:hypothetical protein